MDNPKHEMDDESCTGSDDLVEYTLEEQEEEPEEANPSSAEDLEELVEVSSIPEEPGDEELCEVTKFSKEENLAPTLINVKSHGNALKSVPEWNNTLGSKVKHKITVVPHSSASGRTMKLLNSTQTTIPCATATTSYRLVHTDGTMVMNVAQPQTVKKVISISNTNSVQQTNPKVTLNQNARVLHIQPQTFASTSGGAMKTVTIAKNAIGVKTISAGSLKAIRHAAPASSSGLQKNILQMSTAGCQGLLPVASGRIINSSPSNGNSEDKKVIIKATNVISGKKVAPASNIQQRCVTGMKGVQYVRVLNPRSTTGSGGNPKMIIQTVSKVPATNVSAAVVESETTSVGSPKLVLQNNRTYVVRNGIGKLATSASPIGVKPSIVPTARKIILSGSNVQSLEQYNAATSRINIKKDDVDCNQSPTVTVKQSKSPQRLLPTMKQGNIKCEDTKQQHPDKSDSRFSGHAMEFDAKSMDVETDPSRKNVAYGFPEEAYKKRPCNCTKSQCLKLYCDCFANGEFCYNCNCKDCYNTFEHESERQKAIRCTLERNPNAFKPKIGPIGSTDDGTRLHTKGCNCKRSGCLKNYCECYEAKIPCSGNCKCIGCRNTDQFAQEFNYFGTLDSTGKIGDDSATLRVSGKNSILHSNASDSVDREEHPACSTSSNGLKRSASLIDADISELPAAKQPHNFMTLDVIEATVQCMVAQADECIKRGCSVRTSERMILEEYGRCLLEIKEFAFKTDN